MTRPARKTERPPDALAGPGGARMRRGMALARRGRLAAARAEFEAAIVLDPEAKSAYHALVAPGQDIPEDEGGLAVLDRYLEQDAAGWAFALRGEHKRQLQRDGVGDLRRAVALEPGLFWAWACLGRALAAQEPAEGLACLERAALLAPGCGWVLAWQGEALRRAGRLGEALAALDRALALAPGYAPAYAFRGAALRQAGRLEAAARDLESVVRRDPGSAQARFELSLVQRRLGCFPEALDSLALAAQRNPKYLWSDPAAEADLREAVGRLSADPRAGIWLGRLLLEQGRLEEAREVLDRALAADGGDPRGWAVRGELARRQGDLEAARRDLDRAVAGAPADALARAWRARLLADAGLLEGAAEGFRDAAQADARLAWVFREWAEVLVRLGRSAEAEAALARALGLDPRDPSALRLRERLDGLRR